jgi:hypothetical protein
MLLLWMNLLSKNKGELIRYSSNDIIPRQVGQDNVFCNISELEQATFLSTRTLPENWYN